MLVQPLSMSRAKKTLLYSIKAGKNVCLVGRPGIGKSDIGLQLCDELAYDRIHFSAPSSDPTDLKGFPYFLNGEARMAPFNDLAAILSVKKKTIVIIDDVGQATMAVQNGLMQLLHGEHVGGHLIDRSNLCFFLTTNRLEDKAGVTGWNAALGNRMAIYHVDFELETWIDWAISAGVTTETIAFNKFRGHLLQPPARLPFIPDITPRSVTFFDDVYRQGIDRDYLFDVCSGFLGGGYAAEFASFVDMFGEIPTKEEVLMSPDKARVPETMDGKYAVALMLSRGMDNGNMDATTTYLDRLPKEFDVMAMMRATTATQKLTKTKAFQQWAIKNSKTIV